MAHAFSPISAKPTFGTLKENLYQSDYISRKKAQFTYCQVPSYCNKITSVSSYSQYNSYNLGRYARSLKTCNVIPINKGNLVMGQYTKLDLKHVCTVASGTSQCGEPVIIKPTTATEPFYLTYTIDPNGELFGDSQCGELNYTKYMVFNPPKLPLTMGFS